MTNRSHMWKEDYVESFNILLHPGERSKTTSKGSTFALAFCQDLCVKLPVAKQLFKAGFFVPCFVQ